VARQGDVLIFRIPGKIEVNERTEVSPRNGRLVLLEGEVTGHHHAVDVLDRAVKNDATEMSPTKTSKTVEDLMSSSQVSPVSVRLFSDKEVANKLVRDGFLTRVDLYIGTLVVKGGGDAGIVVTHDEHAGIRLTEGSYYIGRQIESVSGELRAVAD
jgi:hypothetical protein